MKSKQTTEKGNTLKVIRFMLTMAWQKKPSLFVYYFLDFFVDVLRKIQVVVVPKFLIDELVIYLGGSDDFNHIKRALIYTAIIVASQFVANIIGGLVNWKKDLIREYFSEYFEVAVNDHAMEIDFQHTENPEALDQMNKAKEGISWYSGNVTGILDQFFGIIKNAIVGLGVIGVIITTAPLVIPILAVSITLMGIVNSKIKAIEITHWQRLSKFNRRFGYYLYELSDFRFGKDIRMYDSADLFNQKATELMDSQVEVWKSQARKTRVKNWQINLIDALCNPIGNFYIGYKAITHAITLGDFSMCLAASSNIYQAFWSITQQVQQILQRSNYAYQYILFLEYPSAMTKGSRKVSQGKHTIEFKNVSFKYPGSEKFILQNVNIKIEHGLHLAVVGLNGAGKTTFIKLLCRLYDVTQGEILIDGVNIKEYSDEEYRSLFAVVFQDFKMFRFTLTENVALQNSEKITKEEIDKVLKLSGLYDDVQKWPKKEHTTFYKNFDKEGIEPSGGQFQKTAISRALYKNAPIVILDEPTAALDPLAEADIYEHFNSLVGGKTAIYISHRLSSCKFCDQIAVFADGGIKEFGTHHQLMQLTDGIYRNMFETQAKAYR